MKNGILFFAILVLVMSIYLFSTWNKGEMDKFSILISWALGSGANLSDKLEIKELFKDNRYVTAKVDLKKGELLTSIPEKLILTEENPLIQPTCKFYNVTGSDCLLVFLSKEMKNENSFFKHYLDYLPKDFSSYPIFYPDEYLNLLNGSVLQYTRNFLIRLYTKGYEKLKASGANFTFNEYLECKFLVRSRSFEIIYNNKTTSAVVPVSDLFNYDPDKINTHWDYSNKSHTFFVKTSEYVKKGEELFLEYGQESNAYYLFYYGFTVLNPSKKLTYRYEHNKKEISLYNPLEINKAIRHYRNQNNYSLEIISLDDEKKAITLLRTEIIAKLNEFTTHVEEDKKLLLNAEIKRDFNLINIYRVLIEEKEVIIIENIYLCLALERLYLSSKRIISDFGYKRQKDIFKTDEKNEKEKYFQRISRNTGDFLEN